MIFGKIKIGSIVKFKNKKMHDEDPRFYPKKGTIGKVVGMFNNTPMIEWPRNTTSENDVWYCERDWIKKVH